MTAQLVVDGGAHGGDVQVGAHVRQSTANRTPSAIELHPGRVRLVLASLNPCGRVRPVHQTGSAPKEQILPGTSQANGPCG
ncbi:hypothetical protein Aglo01_24620 [Actinokineospora globicatena]|nr:hypothetical protein Aglo01_24620 [Actinokineospora globicatena]GLW85354.1 hypothetical protein Aglo02_29940 [Actinokineospora globicatena]